MVILTISKAQLAFKIELTTRQSPTAIVGTNSAPKRDWKINNKRRQPESVNDQEILTYIYIITSYLA